jgi:hypothetical protein
MLKEEESNTILIIIIKPNLKNNKIIRVGGVSRIGTIKYGIESRGIQTRAELRWRNQQQ